MDPAFREVLAWMPLRPEGLSGFTRAVEKASNELPASSLKCWPAHSLERFSVPELQRVWAAPSVPQQVWVSVGSA